MDERFTYKKNCADTGDNVADAQRLLIAGHRLKALSFMIQAITLWRQVAPKNVVHDVGKSILRDDDKGV